jgi:hypothetical protein
MASGGRVAHFAEPADAAAVDEDDGPAATAPATRTRLRRERIEQFGNIRYAIACDRRLIEFSFGLDIGFKLASKARRGESILIVDFGSQVTQLIARRVREAGRL